MRTAALRRSGLLQRPSTIVGLSLRQPNSRWRRGETYVFVLDTNGNMLVHPDPALEGKNQLKIKDINGKPIIQGLVHTVTLSGNKPAGWYHYEWPVPGGAEAEPKRR